MQTDLIIISEYCEKSNIDPSFILLLEEDGLLDIQEIDRERYIPAHQLVDLEKYSRLYYDLSINVPGISAINHLLGQIDDLKREVESLRNHLSVYGAMNWEEAEELSRH